MVYVAPLLHSIPRLTRSPAWRQHILEGIGRPLPMKDTKNFIVNAAVVLVITYKTGNNLEI